VNPGGGAGWDESPLDIQIPDDARELDRDVLAYHREQRAKRRRSRIRRLAGPLAGHGAIMPLLASILAVCLVAGAMLSVATFSPATAPGVRTPAPTLAASSSAPHPSQTSSVSSSPTASPSTSVSRPATARASATSRSASPSASPSRQSPSGRPGP
jgi:cytoskeletal protein RodZ